MENEKKNQKPSSPKKTQFKSNSEILIELFFMIKEHRKWILLPLLAILAFLSMFVSLSGSQSILPAIYALF